jgi:predicted dehydrogenase
MIGAGEVGAKHLQALTHVPDLELSGVADPLPRQVTPGVPLFADYRAALDAVRPEVVIVATPPGIALTAARQAATSGAWVIVEKPASINPHDLVSQAGDERIFVAFQPHFAPGMAGLLADPPKIAHAHVALTCRRDAHYYHGWRGSYASAGGILHQQAIHGLTLALRVLGDGPMLSAWAETLQWRGYGEPEDRLRAKVTFSPERSLTVEARVDYDGPPRHEVTLHEINGELRHITGRNLEAGLGPSQLAPSHNALRASLYRAVIDARTGRQRHPCLFPLNDLQRPLEVINHIYTSARPLKAGST